MTLSTAPGTGGLSFVTNPPGATIIIDNEEYSIQTPAAINNIPPGEHTFALRAAGYEDFLDTVNVVESRLCCVNADLMNAQAKQVCNPQPIEISGPVTPPTPPIGGPNYGMLIIGILAGIGIILLLEKIFGKEKQ